MLDDSSQNSTIIALSKAIESTTNMITAFIERLSGPKSSAVKVYIEMNEEAEREAEIFACYQRIKLYEYIMLNSVVLGIRSDADVDAYCKPRLERIEQEKQLKKKECFDKMMNIYEKEKESK